MQKKYLFSFLILLLSGCSTLSPPIATTMTVDSWTARGQVAVITPQQQQTADFFWQQQQNHYQLRFFGPLGMGAVQLIGQPQQVTLINSKNQKILASSAEILLQQTLHWTIPVSDLHYWLQGLPAPHHADKKIYNTKQQLQYLNQEGWQIHYINYFSAPPYPRLMTCTRPGLTIRIAIDQWSP